MSYLEWWRYVWQILYRTKFSSNFATIGCCNQWMQYLQLKVALLYCNQIIASITIFWLKQLKVADIATICCTSVALWLQIFAVYYYYERVFICVECWSCKETLGAYWIWIKAVQRVPPKVSSSVVSEPSFWRAEPSFLQGKPSRAELSNSEKRDFPSFFPIVMPVL